MSAAATRGAASRAGPAFERAAPPRWRRSDLLRRVRLALDVAGRALDAALVQPGEPPMPERADGAAAWRGRPLVLAKLVAEAAMLMRCAVLACVAGESDASTGEAVDALARRLAPHARGDPVLAQLCREPGRAIEHAAAHVYLSAIGHPDHAFDAFLQEILEGEPVGSPERLPNHALECRWLAQMRSGSAASGHASGEARGEPGAADAALLASTCVALPLDLLGASTLDLYAFTHVVLYASDMGRRTAGWPRPRDDISADAQAALAAALDADNFDLAAELLWTWPMLGLPWSPAATFAFHLLAAVQDEHGFLPGPEHSAKHVDALPAGEREAIALRTSYHANIAMGILCAAALRPGCAPGESIAVDVDPHAGPHAGADVGPADPAQSDSLLDLLPPAARVPRWRAAHAAQEPARRAVLAPFVLDVVLRRAAAANDLARLREALQCALDGGWTDAPALRQALALLRRATSLARMQADAGDAARLGRRGRRERVAARPA